MSYALVFVAGYLLGMATFVVLSRAECPACGPGDASAPKKLSSQSARSE